MKIVDRYLVRSFVIPFLLCIVTFSSIAIVIDLFNRLDEILKLKTPLITLVLFYLNFIPFTFVQTSPVAALVACLYSVGHLNQNHEMTALRASGLSLFRILMPFLFIGFLVGFLSFWINETVVPGAMSHLNKIKEEKLEIGKEPKKTELKNVALFAQEGDLFYATTYDPVRRILKNLVIFRDNELHTPILKVQAREARWGDGAWILSHGSKYRLTGGGKIAGDPVFFVKDRFPSSVKPDDFLKAKLQADTMNFRDLRIYLKKLKGRNAPSVNQRLSVALHQKIAYPFVNVITILIGFPFVFREKRGASVLRGIGLSGVLGFSFYAVFTLASTLGVQGILPASLAVWMTPFLFGTGGALLLWFAR